MSATNKEIYAQFARIGKALANPVRLELLDLLAQGERSVEDLADTAGMRLGNTSAQLQQLRAANLVESRRAGTRVYYRLAGQDVAEFLGALERLGTTRIAELTALLNAHLDEVAELDPIGVDELVRRLADPDILVVDVRPAAEYAGGHIPGAVSIPLDTLEARLDELPADARIVAYCRGRYCVLGPNATRLLRAHRRDARPFVDGMRGWRSGGHPVVTGTPGQVR